MQLTWSRTVPDGLLGAQVDGQARAGRPQVDRILLMAVLLLMGVGVVAVDSATVHLGARGSTLLHKHLAHVALAFGVLVAGLCVPYAWWRRTTYWWLGAVLVGLLLVFVPGIGQMRGGASRWIALGPLRVQPSEFAKLALVVWLAYSLDKHQEAIRSFSVGILPHLLVCGVFVALCLAEPDLGVSILLAGTMVLMLFAAGTRTGYVACIVALAAFVAGWAIVASPERLGRLEAFFDPWKYRYDAGFQITNGLAALGSGGLWGLGLGQGLQKWGYLLESHTDFILPVIGEELGLVGTLGVLSLYTVVVVRGVLAAVRAPDTFGALLALGVVAWLGSQAAIHVGVNLGMLPAKGLTLPFVSYGGSSLVACALAAGILLNVSAAGAWVRARQEGADG